MGKLKKGVKVKNIVENLLELLPSMTLAGFGGLVRTLVGKRRHETYNWKIGVTEIIIAVFAGLAIHFLLSELNVSDGYKSTAISLTGYSAREILTILRCAFLKKIKTEIEK